MAICINCGKQAPQCLCDECRGIVDIENLCREVLAYKPEAGNELWDRIADEYEKPYQFRDKALELADLLPSPRREYLKILRMSGGYETINSRDKDAFELVYDMIPSSTSLRTCSCIIFCRSLLSRLLIKRSNVQ